jgi:hypothetical protein
LSVQIGWSAVRIEEVSIPSGVVDSVQFSMPHI